MIQKWGDCDTNESPSSAFHPIREESAHRRHRRLAAIRGLFGTTPRPFWNRLNPASVQSTMSLIADGVAKGCPFEPSHVSFVDSQQIASITNSTRITQMGPSSRVPDARGHGRGGMGYSGL